MSAPVRLPYATYMDLIDALQECEEYFADRADADHDETGFIPNKEMQISSKVKSVLDSIGNTAP